MLSGLPAQQGLVVSRLPHSCQPQLAWSQPHGNAFAKRSRHSNTRAQCTSLARAARHVVILCSSSGAGNSSNKKAKKAAGSRTSTPTQAGSASNVAAAAVATTVTTTKAPASSSTSVTSNVINMVNPPLGFSNNIVPATPLVVNSPMRSRTPDEYSSDESMDDDKVFSSLDGSTTPGRSVGRTSPYRCLVLDSRYLPVNVISWFRAVCMGETGKVDVLEYHPGGYAYSAYKAHPLPAVLRVRTFVDVHEFAGRLSLTRKNIMLRDHHRCQYCGSHRDLTLDHVTPVCRGGVNSWTNLVTACMACNQRKGDKSLAQMGWTLPCLPREPTPQEVGVIAGISKSDLEHPPLPWVPYLASYKAMLEKAQRKAAAVRASTTFPVHRPGTALSSSSLDQDNLVTVTVHPAGLGSKAAKAAAAAAAAGGGVKATAGVKAGGKAGKSSKVSSRHL